MVSLNSIIHPLRTRRERQERSEFLKKYRLFNEDVLKAFKKEGISNTLFSEDEYALLDDADIYAAYQVVPFVKAGIRNVEDIVKLRQRDPHTARFIEDCSKLSDFSGAETIEKMVGTGLFKDDNYNYYERGYFTIRSGVDGCAVNIADYISAAEPVGVTPDQLIGIINQGLTPEYVKEGIRLTGTLDGTVRLHESGIATADDLIALGQHRSSELEVKKLAEYLRKQEVDPITYLYNVDPNSPVGRHPESMVNAYRLGIEDVKSYGKMELTDIVIFNHWYITGKDAQGIMSISDVKKARDAFPLIADKSKIRPGKVTGSNIQSYTNIFENFGVNDIKTALLHGISPAEAEYASGVIKHKSLDKAHTVTVDELLVFYGHQEDLSEYITRQFFENTDCPDEHEKRTIPPPVTIPRKVMNATLVGKKVSVPIDNGTAHNRSVDELFAPIFGTDNSDEIPTLKPMD